MIEKIARGLTRKPKLVAAVALLLLIPSLFGFINTRINYDILSYLPQDLPSSQGEQLLEEPFQMAATSMLIVEEMPAGWSNELIQRIREVDGVSNAIWISNLVGIQIPTDMIPASFRDLFFSGDATMMIIQYSHPGASDETMQSIDDVRKVCNEKCFLAGFSVVIKDTRDLMDSELPLFVGLAILMALLAMLVTLESTVLPFIFLASIGLAVIYNFGSNIFLGEISYITKAIAAVLQLGVTMDYSIFLYRRYEEERLHYEDQRDAMAQAIVSAFRSLFGSSLTTIAGFLALCFMRLTLGRDIGIVMAKGVILGVATVILVLPSLVLIFDRQIEAHKHKTLIPSFAGVNRFVLKHRRAFVLLFLLLFLPAIYSEHHAEKYYKLDEALPRDLPSIVANEKLKDDFDMATAHFIVLRDDLTSQEMREMEEQLEALPQITSLLSYHSMLGTGIPDFFIPQEIKEMLRQEGYQLMMVNSSCEPATPEVAEQLDAMNAILHRYDPTAMITGEGAMYQDLIETSAVDFAVTNYISIAAIFLIIAYLFKSLTVPLALVATIELAIFLNQGLNYFLGVATPFVAPTIISCVQLGATVDYAILMSARFQEELRQGKDRMEAIRIAATASDASIATSALVLFCATLGVSFVSSIDLIGAICIMLARGAFISAMVSMFLMPTILCVCEPVFHKTSLHWRTAPPEKAHRTPRLLRPLVAKYRTYQTSAAHVQKREAKAQKRADHQSARQEKKLAKAREKYLQALPKGAVPDLPEPTPPPEADPKPEEEHTTEQETVGAGNP